MGVRVGINGFGRIGRNFFRSARERGADVEIVAVNDLGDAKTMAHLLKYDSVLGPLGAEVEAGDGAILVDGEELRMLSERDPAALPWETSASTSCSSRPASSRSATGAQHHLDAGAPKVAHLGARDRPRRHARARRQRRRLRRRAAPDRLERLLHDELHRAARQGPERRVGDRVRLHDDDPRVHERPADPRPPAQGPAARPRGCDQPDPDLDGRRQGDRRRHPASSRARSTASPSARRSRTARSPTSSRSSGAR